VSLCCSSFWSEKGKEKIVFTSFIIRVSKNEINVRDNRKATINAGLTPKN
jgi:hypothetical protein